MSASELQAGSPNPPNPSVDWLDRLSKEEIASLLETRDGRSRLSVAVNWGMVGTRSSISSGSGPTSRPTPS